MAATATGTGRGAGRADRSSARLTTETKHSSKTSELYIWAAVTIGILLSGLLTKAGDGHDDRLQADQVWLYVAIVSGAYLISRGLAKSGSREPYYAGGDNETRNR
jgi:hypothetical protein